jgi:hypothetical protein
MKEGGKEEPRQREKVDYSEAATEAWVNATGSSQAGMAP